MLSINDIKFDENGLVPAIIIDDNTGEILTLAYMNKESLKISLEKKLTCFWSRSRQKLWLKGETSGHFQHIKSIKADCDRDALAVYVNPDGAACHLGNDSCFVDFLLEEENLHEKFSICGLMELIKNRKLNPVKDSYTSYLFEKGLDKILKKIGEESSEVIIAAKNTKQETIYELSDLIYHMLVLMAEQGIEIKDLIKELAKRHVIDKKVKQEKMA